jgi:hypothetical protein
VHSPDTGADRAGAVSRRQALRLFGGAGFAAGSLALGGCTITKGTAPISTQGLSKDPAPGRKTNIEVYSIFGGTVGQGWVKLASRYEQVQKDVGVRVTYAPGTSSGEQQKLLVAIAANSPPDVAQLSVERPARAVDLSQQFEQLHRVARIDLLPEPVLDAVRSADGGEHGRRHPGGHSVLLRPADLHPGNHTDRSQGVVKP